MTPDRVRDCRHRLRLTVQHLADVLSNEDRTVDARLVRRWEAGQRPVPAPAAFWFERPPAP